ESLRLLRGAEARMRRGDQPRRRGELVEHRQGRIETDTRMQEEEGSAGSTFNSVDPNTVDLERRKLTRRQHVRGHQFTPAVTADFHPIPLLYYVESEAPTKFRGTAVIDDLVFHNGEGIRARNDQAKLRTPQERRLRQPRRDRANGRSLSAERPRAISTDRQC